MIIRSVSEQLQGVEIVQHLLTHRVFQTYLVHDLKQDARYYLVEWDKTEHSARFHGEIELWLSSLEAFPRVIKFQDHAKQPSILTPEFRGISILSWFTLGA